MGDVNRLKLNPILNLSPELKQVVNVPTRKDPDATLDVIITNLHALYESPYTLPPLENDENVRGAPSDHLIVIMRPLSKFSQIAEKKYKMIHYRPFPDSGIRIMGTWLQSLS